MPSPLAFLSLFHLPGSKPVGVRILEVASERELPDWLAAAGGASTATSALQPYAPSTGGAPGPLPAGNGPFASASSVAAALQGPQVSWSYGSAGGAGPAATSAGSFPGQPGAVLVGPTAVLGSSISVGPGSGSSSSSQLAFGVLGRLLPLLDDEISHAHSEDDDVRSIAGESTWSVKSEYGSTLDGDNDGLRAYDLSAIGGLAMIEGSPPHCSSLAEEDEEDNQDETASASDRDRSATPRRHDEAGDRPPPGVPCHPPGMTRAVNGVNMSNAHVAPGSQASGAHSFSSGFMAGSHRGRTLSNTSSSSHESSSSGAHTRASASGSAGRGSSDAAEEHSGLSSVDACSTPARTHAEQAGASRSGAPPDRCPVGPGMAEGGAANGPAGCAGVESERGNEAVGRPSRSEDEPVSLAGNFRGNSLSGAGGGTPAPQAGRGGAPQESGGGSEGQGAEEGGQRRKENGEGAGGSSKGTGDGEGEGGRGGDEYDGEGERGGWFGDGAHRGEKGEDGPGDGEKGNERDEKEDKEEGGEEGEEEEVEEEEEEEEEEEGEEEEEEELHSGLGLLSHWQATYADELATFHETGEKGEIWFGRAVMDTMAAWTAELAARHASQESASAGLSTDSLSLEKESAGSEAIQEKEAPTKDPLLTSNSLPLAFQQSVKIGDPGASHGVGENTPSRRNGAGNTRAGAPAVEQSVETGTTSGSAAAGDIEAGAPQPLAVLPRLPNCGGAAGWPVLDVGTGNGLLLHALARHGFRDLTGSDYCKDAVHLGYAIAAKAHSDAQRRQHETATVRFTVDDVLDTQLHGPYKLIVDKGTLDAINLHPRNAREHRELYKRSVARLLAPDGLLVITSCNRTKDELIAEITGPVTGAGPTEGDPTGAGSTEAGPAGAGPTGAGSTGTGQTGAGLAGAGPTEATTGNTEASCNEAVNGSDEGRASPEAGVAKAGYEVVAYMRSHPTFAFGGSVGSKVCTVAFRLKGPETS